MPAPISDAERIASLQRSIETDQARITDLQRDLADPQSPYAQADAEFSKISEQLDMLRKQGKQAEVDNNLSLAREIAEKIAVTEKNWQESKRRFELEIESRRTKQESLDSLKARLALNKEQLEKLRNPESKEKTPTEDKPPAPSMPTTTEPPASSAAPKIVDPTTGVSLPTTPSTTTTTIAEPVKDDVVLKAESALEARREEASAAEKELEGITRRIESLQRNIQLERRLRDLARQKSIESDAESQRLREEYWKLLSSGEAGDAVGKALEDAQARQRAAQEEATAASNHLDELQSALALIQNDQILALRTAEQRRQEVQQAENALSSVNSPWSAHRIERWLTNQGLRIIVVIVVATLALWGASAMRKRLIELLVSRSRRGTLDERQNRARTLISVFHNAFITFVYGFVAVVLLEAIGYSVAPLLGGAAVLGLAVAFGAQSLIKDYFTGFIVLMEQQYMLNDVIKLGGVSGQVERITLRMTVLRDAEGNVHFVPHGQIATVTNMTHGWSRAVFEIEVAYNSDIDRTTRILMELARDMRRDPAYAALITEEPAMLGVDKLGQSGVLIKFHITTRPLQQWTVKRELLRRIKLRFDEEGIDIPFPQLTLHTVNETAVIERPTTPPNPLLS